MPYDSLKLYFLKKRKLRKNGPSLQEQNDGTSWISAKI